MRLFHILMLSLTMLFGAQIHTRAEAQDISLAEIEQVAVWSNDQELMQLRAVALAPQ